MRKPMTLDTAAMLVADSDWLLSQDFPPETTAKIEELLEEAATFLAARPPYRKRWVTAAIQQWMPLLEEGQDIGCDWAEAHSHCWRCGCERSLQRCHMVPKALGGTLDPANVMPLCADCHAEAPDTDDPADFLAWVKDTRNRGNYESYWAVRCWNEASLPAPVSQQHCDAVLTKWIELLPDCANTHGTHLATSTKVALLKRAYHATPAQA
jgi:HNH endonuclease